MYFGLKVVVSINIRIILTSKNCSTIFLCTAITLHYYTLKRIKLSMNACLNKSS